MAEAQAGSVLRLRTLLTVIAHKPEQLRIEQFSIPSVKYLSRHFWLDNQSLIRRIGQGDPKAVDHVAGRLLKGDLSADELIELLNFAVPALSVKVCQAPNLRGIAFARAYAWALRFARAEADALGSRVEELNDTLTWTEAQNLLEQGPPELLLVLIHTKYRKPMFKFIRHQPNSPYLRLMREFWKREYSEVLRLLPADLLFQASDTTYLESEYGAASTMETALREAVKRLGPQGQQAYAQGSEIRRRLIGQWGTDTEAVTLVAQTKSTGQDAAIRNPHVDLKSLETEALKKLQQNVKSLEAAYAMGGIFGYQIPSCPINSILAVKLIEKSDQTALLKLLARYREVQIWQAFLRRIEEDRKYRTSIFDKRLDSDVHMALLNGSSEDQLIKLASCEGLHEKAQLRLATSEFPRVRQALGKTLHLSQKELRVWTAERRGRSLSSTATAQPSSQDISDLAARAALLVDGQKPSKKGASRSKVVPNRAGVVYLLINPSMPGLVKIGHSTRSASVRSEELSRSTGIPTPFQVVLERNFQDSEIAEGQLHQRLQDFRVTYSREFFRCDVSQAVDALLALHAEQQSQV